jgi:acyl-lipid omega-6 desaturase (Delta-12 desaturase)
MRSGREILSASKEFAVENRLRSWLEILITLLLVAIFLTATFLPLPLAIRIACSLGCAFVYVRTFVIYHDYQHRAILQDSTVASLLMKAVGIFLLAPETIWKRSHEHHHNNNSKLTIAGIGSYPTISKTRFLALRENERRLYLINRHPLTVIFGYFTLFIYWLNLKSFIQSPGKHLDSLFALLFHIAMAVLIWSTLGPTTYLLTWFFPFFISFAMGSYLFYCQHNFPGAKFRENPDWTYVNAALSSTSFMVMNPFMQWITGNIGYHHVHHVNSRIPFYRLIEAMMHIPELHNPPVTSWHPLEMIRCFQLKLWDEQAGEMITMKQFKASVKAKEKKGGTQPPVTVPVE